MRRFSDKVDRLYFIKESLLDMFVMDCLSTDKYLNDCDIVTLDNDMNNENVLIRTNLNYAVTFALRTWATELPILVHGTGFQMKLFETGSNF